MIVEEHKVLPSSVWPGGKQTPSSSKGTQGKARAAIANCSADGMAPFLFAYLLFITIHSNATRMLRRVAYEAAASQQQHAARASGAMSSSSRRRCRPALAVGRQQVAAEGRFLSMAATTLTSCSTTAASSSPPPRQLLTPSSSAHASGGAHVAAAAAAAAAATAPSSQYRQYHVAAASKPTLSSIASLHRRRGGLEPPPLPLLRVGQQPTSVAPHAHAVQQRRHMADNLLGHSPMSRPDPRPKASLDPSGDNKPLIGVDSNTAGGGVWAQTSAKRDKLAELKLEIPPDLRTLDDMATPVQQLDLDLTDGLRLVARAVDGAWADQDQRQEEEGDSDRKDGIHEALAELRNFLDKDAQQTTGTPTMVGRDRFEAHLSEAMRILEPDVAAASPSGRLTPRSALAQLRDFTVYEPEEGEKESSDSGSDSDSDTNDASTDKGSSDADADASPTSSTAPAMPAEVDADLRSAVDPFDTCASYLRLLTARYAAAILRESWDDLTRLTDGDVDRAAVRGDPLDAPTTLALEDVNDVLRAYAAGSCRDRVDAFWNLVDKDKDGRIDEAEMDYLAHWSMKPVEAALKQLVEEALEELPSAEDALAAADGGGGDSGKTPKEKGWRQRRRDAKTKKRMIKLLNKAVANHFDIEVETPHRLRCVYAWAEKEHQNNRIDSVQIESGTIAGRKRYVELAPKISLEEFRSEQQDHFGHLDRVGEELLSSFREDLLVDQGKGRQNKQERKDMLLFLGVVSAVDAVIWSL